MKTNFLTNSRFTVSESNGAFIVLDDDGKTVNVFVTREEAERRAYAKNRGSYEDGTMPSYSYSVSMLGFTSVSGTHQATRSHDAEVRAVQHFMEENAIERQSNPYLPNFEPMCELIRFYAPDITVIG